MSAPEPETAQIPNRASQPLPRVSRRPPPSPGLRAPKTPTRSAWITLAVLGPLALILAWRVLTAGLADLWVESDPHRALFWRPTYPEALFAASDADFANLKFAEAKAAALRAVAAYPLEGRAYRELAGVADFFGDHADAKRLFSLTLRRAPRDITARTKLIDYSLKAGDIAQALHQIDMTMRIQPEAMPDILPPLVTLSQYPEVAAPLSQILVARPPWRQIFLATLADSGTDSAAIDRVFASRGGDDPLPPPRGGTETDLLINRQIKDGRWGTAYVNWAGTLSKSERTVLGNVYDGGFIFHPSNKGFAWQLPDQGTGYDVLIAPRTQFSLNNVMQITFNGLPLNYQPVKQQLILAPGHYRLTGMGQAGAMTSDDGLQWVVACAEGQQQVLVKSQAFTGDMPWAQFQMEFDVPDSDCGAQWLRLDLGMGIFKGQPLEGGAIFDNLDISLSDASASPPANAQTPTTAPATDKSAVDQATIDGLQ